MTSPTQPREFDHVVLTRFSVRFDGWSAPTDEWLRYRWAFFCDALVSSLSNQTVHDFQWLVFFDTDTPSWLREQIDAVSPGLFEPRFVPSWAGGVAREAVAAVTSAPYLITTRIDSDDAVAVDFIADIQACFEHQQALFVNFLCGIQIDRTGAVYRYNEPSNPFISYIEERVEGQLPGTVFLTLSHAGTRHLAETLNIVGPPRWVQIIHGTNVANGVRGLRVRPQPYEADFQFELHFDRSVETARYMRERGQSMFSRLRLWALYPQFLSEYRLTRRLAAQGTQLLPQIPTKPDRHILPPRLREALKPVVRWLRQAEAKLQSSRNRQR